MNPLFSFVPCVKCATAWKNQTLVFLVCVRFQSSFLHRCSTDISGFTHILQVWCNLTLSFFSPAFHGRLRNDSVTKEETEKEMDVLYERWGSKRCAGNVVHTHVHDYCIFYALFAFCGDETKASATMERIYSEHHPAQRSANTDALNEMISRLFVWCDDACLSVMATRT